MTDEGKPVEQDAVKIEREGRRIRVLVEYAEPHPGGHAYTLITPDQADVLAEALRRYAEEARRAPADS